MADKKRPNFVMLWGDDIGHTNLGCYSVGVMGCRTPKIDRSLTKACSPATATASKAAPPVARPLSRRCQDRAPENERADDGVDGR